MASHQLRPIVTLTTDFGLADHYGAVLHGVILRINPHAVVVDLSHSIPPQDIASGAFLLGNSFRFFPKDAIHVAIVDPGVGGSRQAIALETAEGSIFVGPDNGVLSDVMREHFPHLGTSGGEIDVGTVLPGLQIVRLTNRAYWLPQVSSTFHGRDIFAPVAGYLSLGVSLSSLGQLADTVRLLPVSLPIRQPDGTIIAHVIYIDHFGNLITDLTTSEATSLAQPWRLQVGSQTARGLEVSYEGKEGLIAVIGSTNRVEIALPGGSAASLTGCRTGDEVLVCAVR